MSAQELKPCPNPGCAGEPFIDSLWKVMEEWSGYRGACSGCGMRGAFAPTPGAAATPWNSLPRTPEVDWLPEGEVPEGDGWFWRSAPRRGVKPVSLYSEAPASDWFRKCRISRHPIPMPPAPGEEP